MLPAWLVSIITAVLKALFGVVRQGVDDARDDAAHEDVGVLRQRQADTEATVAAKAEADAVALEPRDRPATVKRLRNGTF